MNLAEWLKTQDRDLDPAIGIVEEAIKDLPEFNTLQFRVIAGTSFKAYRRDTLPKGAFREIGQGVSASSSTGKQISVECKFFDSLISVDEAQIMGDMGILGSEMVNEGTALMQGNMQTLADQIYYGTDSNGFSGYNSMITSEMTVNAVTDAPASYSSVYFVNSGLQGIQFIGGNSVALALGDIYQEDVTDADGKSYRAYKQRMRGWYGLQNASTKCVGKISYLNASNPLTQDLMAGLLSKFSSRAMPTAIYMNRDVYFNQWLPEKAKVGILKTGSTKLDIKSDYDNINLDSFMGVPIYVTDAIKNNEA
jgi:hypothetical protein